MVGVYAHSPRTIIARTSYSYEVPSSLSGGSVGKVLSGNFTFLGIQPESAQGVVETDASLDPAKTDDRDALADEEVRSGKANSSVVRFRRTERVGPRSRQSCPRKSPMGECSKCRNSSIKRQ